MSIDQSKKVKHVLILDDEPHLLDLYEEKLKDLNYSQPYSIEVIRNTSSVLGYLDATEIKFDLIITDLKMPNISGQEFLTEILNSPATKNTPVIIISGFVDPETHAKYGTQPHIRILKKPFSDDDFNSSVLSLISLQA